MDKYYKPSGKFSPVSLLLFLIVIGFTALPLLGLLYAYAIWYIPFFYINFLIAAAFGVGIGYAINWGVIGLGKVRNSKAGLITGFIGALIALYFHWAVWVDLVINAGAQYGNSKIGITVSNIKILQVFELALNPSDLFRLIEEISKVGTWSIRSTPAHGWGLIVIWIIEALMVIIIPTSMAYFASKKPFCETNKSWFKEKELPAFNHIEEKQKIIIELENANSNLFKDLIKAESLEKSHSIFTIYYSDNGEYYLTIKNKIAKTDSKGKVEFDDDEFIEYISIGKPLAEMLMSK